MRKEGGWNGSYTVESAFVMPMVIGMLAGLISLALFLHDKVCMLALMNQCLTRAEVYSGRAIDFETGDILYEENICRGLFYPLQRQEEQEQEIERHLLEMAGEKYWFLLEAEEADVEVKLSEIKAEIKPAFKNTLLSRLLPLDDIWTKTIPIHRPAELLRAFGSGSEEKLQEGSGGIPELSLEQKMESAEKALEEEKE